MRKIFMHEGDNLKIALANKGITVAELAAKMNTGRRTVYDWFLRDTIKPVTLAKITKATGITASEITEHDLLLHDTEPKYGVVHHGKIIKNVLHNKGVKIDSFARRMHLTRTTVYKRFGERDWDAGELMKAAEILQVPLAQLKGKGEGHKSFEKDIYDELRSIKLLLQKVYENQVGTMA